MGGLRPLVQKESKMADSITKHPNDANYIVRHLSTKPNEALKDFDEWIASSG